MLIYVVHDRYPTRAVYAQYTMSNPIEKKEFIIYILITEPFLVGYEHGSNARYTTWLKNEFTSIERRNQQLATPRVVLTV